MKTIVNCWIQKTKDYEIGPGLGDLIQGTIFLYQFCKKNNYTYIVDIQKHPLSPFFMNSKSSMNEYLDGILEKDVFFFNHASCKNWNNFSVEQYINTCSEDIIVVNTNEFCSFPLSLDDVEFIQKILEPSDIMKSFLDNCLSKFPINYTIQHYRLGDNILVHGIVDCNFENIYYKLWTNYEDTDILVSDSSRFKSFTKKRWGITMLDVDVGHIGYHKDFDKLKNTMLDFYIVSKCKKIKSYSVYGGSHFVKMLSACYDIPLILI